ncbi:MULTISPECIES: P-type conjugative transfer protein TrbJ [Phyllobacteriaceae]|jgi:type IV secretion system protein TrbJ|uniref:P-type conjugative transfer protein TrbJ n=1 Tax=Mesorhizobium hungaricum TaxID=1566387 RepID=A0A1C2EA13_9HYPH|nr:MULTISPECIES: P-type conjugative transfer protein TrbJ [Mesorhizobium]MBN9237229.1 P-type conjugative transfer protein TrbJ [Mesorhizobium sp.]MDQ0329431.1 P-type conjugative transfer protein TrbJ [Mesorhizobium sp. YL-MeA3-2017]OCX23821.1 P-type conjugative transfer protein TrbJ [Mesorhizobium hungaricum]
MTRRRFLCSLFAVSLIAKSMAGSIQPAHARIVFDPSNYAQNVLTAARSLEQINNQIQSLQNQATMLQNMARNLQRLDFSSLGQLTGALHRIDGLMDQAGGLSFDLDKLQGQWRSQYPESYDASIKISDVAGAARGRWQNAMQAFRQTMSVQSQIVENVRSDGDLLADLVSRSQSAAGALQASQATNQLIALSTKQQMQIQTLLATQFRAEVEDAARKAQSEEAARQMTKRFLGSGAAYRGN